MTGNRLAINSTPTYSSFLVGDIKEEQKRKEMAFGLIWPSSKKARRASRSRLRGRYSTSNKRLAFFSHSFTMLVLILDQ